MALRAELVSLAADVACEGGTTCATTTGPNVWEVEVNVGCHCVGCNGGRVTRPGTGGQPPCVPRIIIVSDHQPWQIIRPGASPRERCYIITMIYTYFDFGHAKFCDFVLAEKLEIEPWQ